MRPPGDHVRNDKTHSTKEMLLPCRVCLHIISLGLQVDMKQNPALAKKFEAGSKPDLFVQYDKTHDDKITLWEFCGLFVDLAARDSFAGDKSNTTATNEYAWRRAKKDRETKEHTHHGHLIDPLWVYQPVRDPTTRTIFQQDGPNHLGLW